MAKKKEQPEEQRDNVIDAIKMLAKERGIDEEELIRAVEEGIVTAFKREFGGAKIDQVSRLTSSDVLLLQLLRAPSPREYVRQSSEGSRTSSHPSRTSLLRVLSSRRIQGTYSLT